MRLKAIFEDMRQSPERYLDSPHPISLGAFLSGCCLADPRFVRVLDAVDRKVSRGLSVRFYQVLYVENDSSVAFVRSLDHLLEELSGWSEFSELSDLRLPSHEEQSGVAPSTCGILASGVEDLTGSFVEYLGDDVANSRLGDVSLEASTNEVVRIRDDQGPLFFDVIASLVRGPDAALVLGEASVTWIANAWMGHLSGLRGIEPMCRAEEKVRLAEFEKLVREYYAFTGVEVPWYRLVRLYEGNGMQGVERFVGLWLDYRGRDLGK